MSMQVNNNTNHGGIGFFGLLTVLFVGLKLTGFINWSWFWVLSPLWGGFLLFIVAITLILAAALFLSK